MSQVEPIFTVSGENAGPMVGTVRGLGQLEELLREFVDRTPPASRTASLGEVDQAVRCLSTAAASDLDARQDARRDAAMVLGVEVVEVQAADLDNDTWARLVWQTCRDGSTWWEDEDTSLRISDVRDIAPSGDQLARAGLSSGLSPVDPALPADRIIRAVVTCSSLDTARLFDGQVDTWTSVRDLVSDARTRYAQTEVKKHHERYERLKADLELARRTRARAVQDALAVKVPLERLQTLLGVKRAQVYAIASTASSTATRTGTGTQ